MKPLRLEKTEKIEKTETIERRHLLKGIGTVLAALTVTSTIPKNQTNPQELSLKEADFYAPHSLAG